MYTHTPRKPKIEMGGHAFILSAISLLDDPTDIIHVCAVSHTWRRFVIQRGLCKRLFMERFPRVTDVAYEVEGRYQIIRLSDIVLTGDVVEWGALQREHIIYSYLLQPRSKLMNCPRDCLLVPVAASSIVMDILTSTTPVCKYLVRYSFLSSEGQSETRVNFLQSLESDAAISILSFLDDPADVVRVSAVSRFWHHFVIINGLAKKLCLKVFPQLSTIAGVVIGSSGASSSVEAGNSSSMKLDCERDHKVYASLLHAIKNSKVFRKDYIEYAISASSTNNFPGESIRNTLHPRDPFLEESLYWLSKGQSNPQVPETLIFKLRPAVWLITEIEIQPFKAFFQNGRPIYSARSVRFRMGNPKSENEISSDPESFPLPNGVDDKFVWTYTSPEFSMVQENLVHPYKLPEPVLCLGGYMQVEFLGRVQRQESDGLFYIRMNLVRVVGRPLNPAFDTEDNGEMWLRYHPEFLGSIMKCARGNYEMSRVVR